MNRAVFALVPAVALIAAFAVPAAADPIADATYKGKVRGDGDKIEFNTSFDGKLIGSLSLQFDSRCVQGGNHYTNKNTSFVLYQVKIRPSGKFKGTDKRDYPGGGDVSVARGRFSADGKTAKGKFSFHGTFSGGGVERVECSASGRFAARTRSDPPDDGQGEGGVPLGTWKGTTAQGHPIEFEARERSVNEITFVADVDCVRDSPTAPPFTEEYSGFIERAELNGSRFDASFEAERVSGEFDGNRASGVLSVTNYESFVDPKTCSTPGDVAWTARLRD